jgi:zinc D-Ala-D-Ala dipeptidase
MRRALFCATALLVAPGLARPDGPPRERGPFRAPDLVELVRLEPTLKLDIRYATPDNLAHRAVYSLARAFLQRPAAEALVRAHRTLKTEGYGLLIFDGYRPWSVTKLFWDVTPPAGRAFVADPKKGSKHNRGCAVDLSLFDLKTGLEVEMPSPYDDMSERAHPDYAGGTAEQRRRRDQLRRAMEAEGFTVEPNEWWHFNYKDWPHYPILDIPFERLGAPRPASSIEGSRASKEGRWARAR